MSDSYFGILYLSIVTFGISSMWLYSELFREIREQLWGLNENKNWLLRKLSYLGICQLCISFWISLCLQLYFFENSLDWQMLTACGIAGVSWLLGAITRAFLFLTAVSEKDLERY